MDLVSYLCPEMKFVFKKLFYYSIDMPAQYDTLKNHMDLSLKQDLDERMSLSGRSSYRVYTDNSYDDVIS